MKAYFMENALEIRNLSVRIEQAGDRTHAVDNVSFDIPRNSITCVVGESGSGKSVTAASVMGLLQEGLAADGGEILFKDQNILDYSRSQWRKLRGRSVSMIFQEPMSALNPLMTVGNQIAEVFHNNGEHGEVVRDKVIDLIRAVRLPNPEEIVDAYPFRLSGGQRQRVVIAIALALRPQLLIADEPTTALDVTTQAQILQLIKELQAERGTAVMFITHDFGVVADIADNVVVMRHGKVVEAGKADDIMRNPQHEYTRLLLASLPRFEPGKRSEVAPAQPILAVDKLRKTYLLKRGFWGRSREIPAVHDVSFSLRPGETLGVVGESGSGKSTVGRCIIKLVDFNGGQVLLDGQDISALTSSGMRKVRHKIQMVFQDPFASLNPKRTVRQTLMTSLAERSFEAAQAEARCRELMQLVGLPSNALDRYPNEFSGGQRQRIAIARAIAPEPSILIADEAVSALDVSIQKQILGLFADLQAKLGLAMVFITHDLRVAAQVSDRIMVLHKGEVVETGPTEDVFLNPQHDYTRTLLAAMPGLAVGA